MRRSKAFFQASVLRLGLWVSSGARPASMLNARKKRTMAGMKNFPRAGAETSHCRRNTNVHSAAAIRVFTTRLFLGPRSASCTAMWKCLAFGCALVGAANAQPTSAQLELANLREDVRGLNQRVGELTLRLEQLERENAELRSQEHASAKSFATVSQLKDAMADVNQNLKMAVAGSKKEILENVGEQLEKLGRQTNAAIDSLVKSQAPKVVQFPDDFPKEGISYEVQKGDTLAVIARKTGAKQQDIINANKLADPSRIVIGQKLFIPGGK